MKILAINNYSLEDCLNKSKSKAMPAHHCWGCDYLLFKGHKVKYVNYNKRLGGVKYRLLNLLFCLRNIHYFNQFDAIVSFANPIIGWCALFKKIGLIRPSLYTLVHHRVRFMELYSGYEKIFFLSKQIMRMAEERYPHLASKMIYLEWGADLSFYDETYKEMLSSNLKKNTLISNGKTARDINLLQIVYQDKKIPMIVITDKIDTSFDAITSGQKDKNAISYHELLKYMAQSLISLIPIKADKPKCLLCGLTSFLDALALGQPIIMSDNTNISVDIEALGIGLIYKAGDEEDLISKIEYMRTHLKYAKECGVNARKYAEKHSYKEYCEQLERLIQKEL